MNDVDMEQAACERIGNTIGRLRKAGICSHGSVRRQADGSLHCQDCPQIFADDEEWREAWREFKAEYC